MRQSFRINSNLAEFTNTLHNRLHTFVDSAGLLLTSVVRQELFEANDFVDELLCSVGAGTSSCATACATARAAVYGASSSIPKSIVQVAKCGTWGEQAKNVD